MLSSKPQALSPVRVAVVQARPAFLDLDACLAQIEVIAAEASQAGAKLVAFGETFVPGYPAWLDVCPEVALWDHLPTRETHALLRRNSVCVPSPATEKMSEVSARHSIVMIIGVSERVKEGPGHGTLYNSLLTFDADGRLVNHHRKLVPTYTEKLVWGPGDAQGLQSVETQVGRVGAMVCWEHWMPLARQAMHDSAEQIHVAAWPTVKEMHQIASRQYAFEGRCFVIASGSILEISDLPKSMPTKAGIDPLLLRGGSAIIAPDGRYLAGPVFDEETILYADLDLGEIDEHVLTLDTTGHYQRPDVFEFGVRRKRV